MMHWTPNDEAMNASSYFIHTSGKAIRDSKMAIVHVIINTSRPELFKNGTIFHLDEKKYFKDSELNELLYVVIVIMFYAMALMILIATQIRKQRRGQDIEYYDEHLERTKKESAKATAITTTPLLPKTTPRQDRKPPTVGLESIVDEQVLEEQTVWRCDVLYSWYCHSTKWKPYSKVML